MGMGGSSSQSQQSSQSTSDARQALFTPSPASITDSINQLLGIYQQSTANLAPFNQTAFDATNDMRYWQGMAGIDPALQQSASLQGYMDTLKAPGKSSQLVNWTEDTVLPGKTPTSWGDSGATGYGNIPGSPIQHTINVDTGGGAQAFGNQKNLMSSLSDVNKNLTLLSTEQDPTKRQALYDSVMQGFTSFDSTSSDILKQYTAGPSGAVNSKGTEGVMNDWIKNNELKTTQDKFGSGNTGTFTDSDGVVHAMPDNWWNMPDYQVQSDKGTGANGGMDASSQDFLKQVTNIDTLKDQVMAKFKKEGNPAPTADQVLARLQGTPGYTTQLNQGLQSIQNSEISKGLFGSGRAAKEITRFGQDYAQNALTNQFNRSAQLAGLTMPSVSQQSQNTVAQAAPIMASTQLAGSNWSMSPWTQRSQSTSQGTSSSKTDGGGLGQVLGAVMGGIF